jgi:hypothetical protein
MAVPHTSSKYLASIAALELSNALQNLAPAAPFSQIGTVQLQALRQLSDIFSAALPSRTKPQAPPLSQNSSQFRSTVQQGPADQTRMPQQPVPTPVHSPSLAPRRSQRVIPIHVNTSGKASAQIFHLPLGDDSSPSGDSAVGI